jgi:hypothetical protein
VSANFLLADWTLQSAPKIKALVEFLVKSVDQEPAWDIPLIERGWLI